MNKIIDYVKSSFNEVLTKVAWPKYKELQSQTIIVLIGSVVFALLVYGVDLIFNFAMDAVY